MAPGARQPARDHLLRDRPRGPLPPGAPAVGHVGDRFRVPPVSPGPGRLRPPGRSRRRGPFRRGAAARGLLAHGGHRRHRGGVLAARAGPAAARGDRPGAVAPGGRHAPPADSRRRRRRPRHVDQVQPRHAGPAVDRGGRVRLSPGGRTANRGGGARRARVGAPGGAARVPADGRGVRARVALRRARRAALPLRLRAPEPDHGQRVAGVRTRRQRLLVQRHAQPDGGGRGRPGAAGRRRPRLGTLAAHAAGRDGRALRRRLLRLHRYLEGAGRPVPPRRRAAPDPAGRAALRRGGRAVAAPPSRRRAAGDSRPHRSLRAAARVLDRLRRHAQRRRHAGGGAGVDPGQRTARSAHRRGELRPAAGARRRCSSTTAPPASTRSRTACSG